MKTPFTKTQYIGRDANARLFDYLAQSLPGRAVAVCDVNTETFSPIADRFVFEDGVTATDLDAEKICEYAHDAVCLIAVGSGTLHDLTRFAAHKMGKPFVSYPTAASVDGFVSAIAAMTIGGRKISYPSTPPVALFCDPAVIEAAPAALTASGVGDIVGKYISLCDWDVGHALTGEEIDPEIYELQLSAVRKVMEMKPSDAGYVENVLSALVISGMAIQYMGNSRPASGAEHHLSHLWEMHRINDFTPALHGEKVGVSTLIVLGKYKSLLQTGVKFIQKRDRVCHAYLEPVYRELTDGIIEENTPSPLDDLTAEGVAECEDKIKALVKALPNVDFIRDYLLSVGAKTTLSEIDLPDSEAFKAKSLEFAPYVRRRLTLLKLI